MKQILTTVLAILSALSLSGLVSAQSNEAYIEQVGDGNEAIQVQEGFDNGGFDPELFIVTEIDPYPPVELIPPVPPDALVFHSLDHWGVYLKQKGNDNIADQKQIGNYDRNYIWQEGSDHVAQVYQIGNNLVHSLKQYGNGCSYIITQGETTPLIIVTQTK